MDCEPLPGVTGERFHNQVEGHSARTWDELRKVLAEAMAKGTLNPPGEDVQFREVSVMLTPMKQRKEGSQG